MPAPTPLCPHSDTLNIVASDHRPFSTKQKAMGKEDFTKIPHGVSGVQDRMNIIWERGVVWHCWPWHRAVLGLTGPCGGDIPWGAHPCMRAVGEELPRAPSGSWQGS